MPMMLWGTVGERAQNKLQDVRLVERLLIAQGQHFPKLREVEIDGACGPALIAAIKEFQQHKKLLPPDGVVAPSDSAKSTWRHLISGLRPSTAGFRVSLQEHAKRLAKPDAERFVEHIYLDSEGYTTLGVGTLIEQKWDDLEATVNFVVSENIVLVDKTSKRKAGVAEIRNDIQKCWDLWEKVKAPLGWKEYEKETSLRIDKVQAEELCRQHLAADLEELRKKFIGFDRFPLPARDALLDMNYNMGRKFRLGKWPTLFNAISVGDWYWTAEESNRPQIGTKRNQWTRQRFIAAANELPSG